MPNNDTQATDQHEAGDPPPEILDQQPGDLGYQSVDEAVERLRARYGQLKPEHVLSDVHHSFQTMMDANRTYHLTANGIIAATFITFGGLLAVVGNIVQIDESVARGVAYLCLAAAMLGVATLFIPLGRLLKSTYTFYNANSLASFMKATASNMAYHQWFENLSLASDADREPRDRQWTDAWIALTIGDWQQANTWPGVLNDFARNWHVAAPSSLLKSHYRFYFYCQVILATGAIFAALAGTVTLTVGSDAAPESPSPQPVVLQHTPIPIEITITDGRSSVQQAPAAQPDEERAAGEEQAAGDDTETPGEGAADEPQDDQETATDE